MKALLKKDLYTIRNTAKMLVLMLVLGVVATIFIKDQMFISMFLGMAVMQIVYNTFSYDDTAKWDQYAVALPVSRKTIVLSKYILLLIGSGVAWLTGVLAVLITYQLFPMNLGLPEALASFSIVILAYLFSFSLALPFVYKLGIEKARYISVAAILVPFFLTMWLISFLGPKLYVWFGVIPWQMVAAAAIALVVLAFLASLRISMGIYRKKEF